MITTTDMMEKLPITHFTEWENFCMTAVLIN